jgi:hypothetical protein
MPKKKAAKTKATLDQLFSEWWKKNADKKVARIANSRGSYRLGPWLESGDGKAYEVVWGLANNAFRAGHLGEIWKPSEDMLCGLDKIIEDAYLAGKESVS